MPSGAPTSTESKTLPHESQTVNESSIQRPDQNTQSVAMFSNIESLYISGGIFEQNIFNINNPPGDEDALKHVAFQSLPRSRDAAFSAAINHDNLSRRACTNGTRVDIIARLTAWINEDPGKAPPIYWLTGLAGLGKTTIAYTICQLLNDACLPFVSFFCSLQLDSRNSKLLVPTLCRDLAELYTPYAVAVLSVLETNAKAVDAGLQIQINELLVKPWQASIAQRNGRDRPTLAVIVDALDESDHGIEFLEELLRVIHAGQLAGIKFLVTSRPEPSIVALCKAFPPNAVCTLHEVDPADVQSDIEKYLQEALPKLKDEPELALLSQRAGGLFIYATTAVRFVSPPHSRSSVSEMRSHLRAMLDPETLSSHADSDSDERLLVDELYERILGDAFRDARVRATRLRILHTIVCAESSINISVLADLTNTDQDTVERVVESLHAVLFVSPNDGCVYWYHASFLDFVFSRVRARIIPPVRRSYSTPKVIDVFCDAPGYHGVLARRSFSVMQESLHFNILNLPSSYLFDSEVTGLHTSIDKAVSPTLRYVSRHWARHLLRAVSTTNDTDDLLRGLKDFLCNKLLFWIEAMNLIGAKSECSSLLKDAESWLERGTKWPDLLDQLADAANFSAFFAGSLASKSTPHLYISALSMWNQDSAIWRRWRDRFKFIPSISLPKSAITIPLLTIPTSSGVVCVAFSPNGNRIVSSSQDHSVRVWGAKTGELLREMRGHTHSVHSVAFSSDGNRIVSCSEDKSARVWDAKTGEQVMELRGHMGRVTSVGFSPNGNRIVTSCHDKSVRVWDAKTGELLRELQGHTLSVTSAAFSPDGNRIVSGSDDRSVRVWDANTGEQVRELHGDTEWVDSVEFLPNGNRIVSVSYDKSMRVVGQASGVTSVVFSPDNELVSFSYDKSVLPDPNTGEQQTELGHTEVVTAVAFSPDGNLIVSGSRDKSVRVWDAKTGEQLKNQGHNHWVNSVAFSPDGNRIVSGSEDKSVRVWDRETSERSRNLRGHTEAVTSVAFSPDGNRIVSGSNDKSILVWGANTGEQPREPQGHKGYVLSVAFSPDGNRIVSSSLDASVQIWDANTGELVTKLQGYTNVVNSLAFSPDGHRIVSGSDEAFLQVWDAKTGEQLKELQGHVDDVTSVAFSPDGNRIVSGSFDESVRVWDAETGVQLRELLGHTEVVTSVAFSLDGNRIVSSSWDTLVIVWDANTGELLRELEGHNRDVTSVAFSPDGNRIVSGSRDRSVRVWDGETGELLRELQGHTEDVTSVAFSPNGNRIVSGSWDKSVRVWDAKTGELLRELQGHTAMVTSVAFSPEGNRVLSGSNDNSVRMWANLNLDDPWVMNEDGWILSGAERLVWVPSTVCTILRCPHSELILSRNGSASISFTNCKLGTIWHECYTP